MPKIAYSEAFERFWAAYPARDGNPKAAAWTIFERISRGGRTVTEDELVQAATHFATDCRRRKLDPKYVPHARTWLSQNRWADHLTGQPVADQLVLQPDPAHPLAALKPAMSGAAWLSWIAPLGVEQGPDGPIVRAPSAYHAERVRTIAGDAIRRVLGRDVEVLP